MVRGTELIIGLPYLTYPLVSDLVHGARQPAETMVKGRSQNAIDNDPNAGALSDSDSSSLPSSMGSFQEATFRLTSIAERIDSLYGMAMKIRNPRHYPERATINLYQNVPPEEREEYMRSRDDIETNIVGFIRQQQIREEIRSEGLDPAQAVADYARPSHWLIRRTGEANARRKQQFVYWKRRSKALALRKETQTSAVVRPKVENVGAHQQLPASNLLPVVEAGRASVPQSSLPSKATSATYLNPDIAIGDDARSVASQLTRISSVVSPMGDKLQWPPPPAQVGGGSFFTCPYCSMLCPKRYLGPEEWRSVISQTRNEPVNSTMADLSTVPRNHLTYDLRPYHCTYEDCNAPHQLYSTRRDWVAHENQHRQSWLCREDGEEFESQSLYVQHLRGHHHKATEADFTPELLAAAIVPSSQPQRDCPFCPSTFLTVANMHEHLIYHLEKLAFLALPSFEDTAHSQLSGSSHDSNKVLGNRGRNDSARVDFTGSEKADFLSLGIQDGQHQANTSSMISAVEFAKLLEHASVVSSKDLDFVQRWRVEVEALDDDSSNVESTLATLGSVCNRDSVDMTSIGS